jgi:hypothetical protein
MSFFFFLRRSGIHDRSTKDRLKNDLSTLSFGLNFTVYLRDPATKEDQIQQAQQFIIDNGATDLGKPRGKSLQSRIDDVRATGRFPKSTRDAEGPRQRTDRSEKESSYSTHQNSMEAVPITVRRGTGHQPKPERKRVSFSEHHSYNEDQESVDEPVDGDDEPSVTKPESSGKTDPESEDHIDEPKDDSDRDSEREEDADQVSDQDEPDDKRLERAIDELFEHYLSNEGPVNPKQVFRDDLDNFTPDELKILEGEAGRRYSSDRRPLDQIEIKRLAQRSNDVVDKMVNRVSRTADQSTLQESKDEYSKYVYEAILGVGDYDESNREERRDDAIKFTQLVGAYREIARSKRLSLRASPLPADKGLRPV